MHRRAQASHTSPFPRCFLGADLHSATCCLTRKAISLQQKRCGSLKTRGWVFTVFSDLSARTRAALSAGSVNAFYFLPLSSHLHKHIVIVEPIPLTSLKMRVQGEMGIYATLQGGCVCV